MNCPRADPKRHVYTFSRQLSLPKVEFCAGKGNFLRRGSREIPKGQTQIEWGDGVFFFRCCRLSRVITRTHNIDSRASPPTWRHTLLYFSRSALSFFLPQCLFPRGNDFDKDAVQTRDAFFFPFALLATSDVSRVVPTETVRPVPLTARQHRGPPHVICRTCAAASHHPFVTARGPQVS